MTIGIFGFFLVWNSVWIIYKTTLQPHTTRDGTTKTVLRKEGTYDQIVKSWKDLLLSVTGCKTWLFHLVTQEGEIKSQYHLNIDGYLKLWQSNPVEVPFPTWNTELRKMLSHFSCLGFLLCSHESFFLFLDLSVSQVIISLTNPWEFQWSAVSKNVFERRWNSFAWSF